MSPSIRRRSLYFIQVVVPPADLIVTGVGTAATTVQAGQTVSVSNSIKNQGGTRLGRLRWRFICLRTAPWGMATTRCPPHPVPSVR